MFITNRHSKIYQSIIDKRRIEVLEKSIDTEVHHIIPVSMGGTNDADNLIRLTLREHYMMHILLVFFVDTQTEYHYKMVSALHQMQRVKNKGVRASSRLYASLKLKYRKKKHFYISNIELNKTVPWYDLNEPIPEGWYKGGLPKTDEWKNSMSELKTGIPRPEISVMSIGKEWYHHPETQDLIQLYKGKEVPCGYIIGHGGLLDRERKYKFYNNGVDQITITMGDPIPDGYVNGVLKDESYFSMLESKKFYVMTNEEKQVRVNLLKDSRKGKTKYFNESTHEIKYFIKNEQPEGWRIGANRGYTTKPQTDAQKGAASIANSSLHEVWLKDGSYMKFNSMNDFLHHFNMDRNHVYHKNCDSILLEKYGIKKLIRHQKNSQK